MTLPWIRRSLAPLCLTFGLLLAQNSVGQAVALEAALTPAQVSYYRARLAAPTTPSVPMGEPHDLAEKVVRWAALTAPTAKPDFAALAAFLPQVSDWPLADRLRSRAEAAMGPLTPMADRLAYFQAFPPVTAAGKLKGAQTLWARGQRAEASAAAREAWRSGALGAADDAALLAQFSTVLEAGDHAERVDADLWRGDLVGARRAFVWQKDDQALLTAARLALQGEAADVDARLAAVPLALQNHAGLIYARAERYRKRNELAAARSLLLTTRPDARQIRDWAAWIQLRTRLAKDLPPAETYALLASHGLPDARAAVAERSQAERVALADATWEAGRLALRVLGQPRAALEQFSAMWTIVQSPVSLSRAGYWAGRAAQAMGDKAMARKWYADAARMDNYFYGQLAAERLGQSPTLPSMAPPSVDGARVAAFNRREEVRAVRLLRQLDSAPLQGLFVRHIAERARTPEEKRLAADLARDLERLDLAVSVGKLAEQRGMDLAYAAYPRIPLARDLDSLWTMVHAISRQESLFNARAISHAGARGLMQLMPGTARETAKKVGVGYDFSRLTADPEYNMMLGSAYFQGLLNRYGGNHVMAVAAYNAGPGRVQRWVAANGDPRDPAVDVLDWIEGIGVSETRNYVQRVLENAVVYRLMEPNAPSRPPFGLLSSFLGREDVMGGVLR